MINMHEMSYASGSTMQKIVYHADSNLRCIWLPPDKPARNTPICRWIQVRRLAARTADKYIFHRKVA
jgi:hypothetical protein